MSTTHDGMLASSSSLSGRGLNQKFNHQEFTKTEIEKIFVWPKPQQYQKRYLRRRANAEELERSVQFEQQDRERVNLDHCEVDNSELCSEGRRVEREKPDLFKKFKITCAKCPRSQNVHSSRND